MQSPLSILGESRRSFKDSGISSEENMIEQLKGFRNDLVLKKRSHLNPDEFQIIEKLDVGLEAALNVIEKCQSKTVMNCL